MSRVDILMDLGTIAASRTIDRGQVIGGFVQGMGWVTTEELLYSETGELLSNSPNNYKIPGVECMPRILRVDFLENSDNPINLLGSKAVGEPPFVLGISVGRLPSQRFQACRQAVRRRSRFPVTSEEVLKHLPCIVVDEPSPPANTLEEEIRAGINV